MRCKAILAVVFALAVAACGGGGGGGTSPSAGSPLLATTVTAVATTAPSGQNAQTSPKKTAFLGAFFRAEGPPPFGVFSALSPSIEPSPYPLPGAANYCTSIAANGVSISSGNLVDPVKLNNIVALGVRWVRTGPAPFFDDLSHILGNGQYKFGDFDSAQCSTLTANGIRPVVELDAGPVEYNSVPGQFSPVTLSQYQSAADFGTWCGAVTAHERAAFPAVTQFSLPGNEVNVASTLFPGGNAQIASYSRACYAAVKAANPAAFVYGFELNMDGSLDVPGFIRQMLALGCGPGTCYDGLAIHLTLRYPIPASTTPCYPATGGDYGTQCIAAVQTAAGSPIHVLISESVYSVPWSVPDEATKALAIIADFTTLSTNASVDGVLYGNVDECGLYPTGAFSGGCLITTSNQVLPGYLALQQLALAAYQ